MNNYIPNGAFYLMCALEVAKVSSIWKLRFDIGAYYWPDKTFFLWWSCHFLVQGGKNSITAYRGSRSGDHSNIGGYQNIWFHSSILTSVPVQRSGSKSIHKAQDIRVLGMAWPPNLAFLRMRLRLQGRALSA